MVYKGVVGAAVALFILFLLQTILFVRARRDAEDPEKVQFMDLIITSEDRCYSLSRLQMYLWTGFVATAFSAVFFASGRVPDIPQNLYLLMGVNLAASVASTALARPDPTHRASSADFVKDIFYRADGSSDLPRTQMFVWTVISLLAFVVMVGRSFQAGEPALADIPLGLVVLMGVSHGAYLGGKKADEKIKEKMKP